MSLPPAAPRKVSVVVPTRDRPAMLRQALASIRALEAPDLQFEILVGDNGRSETNRAIAAEFGATWIPVERLGPSAARNAAMKAATGDYLAFLDDDDVWLPGHIRPHLALLDAQPELEAVIGRVVYVDPELRPLTGPMPETSPGQGDDLLRAMLSGFFPQIGTAVARLEVRDLSGGLDEKLLGGEDLDWLLHIARRRALAFTDAVCIHFRSRPPGSYDRINQSRIGDDRKVFLRHALPEWRIWKSPMAFGRAYSGTLMHFYNYFTEAAESRAARGERGAALKAAWIAAGIFPLRAAWHLLRPTPLRRALAMAAGLRRAPGKTG